MIRLLQPDHIKILLVLAYRVPIPFNKKEKKEVAITYVF